MKIGHSSQISQTSLLTSVTKEKAELVESTPKLSIEHVKQKYDVTDISPKEIDALVKNLRDNNLAGDADWLMLATHGNQFRSSLPGYNGGDKKINLPAVLSNQLAMAKRRSDQTESIEHQISFVNSLIGENSSHSTEAVTNPISERNEEWLTETMQRLLDNRMGVDREKIKDIDEKIKAIENDNSISKADKAALINALEQQKDELLEKAAKEAIEKEKKLASSSPETPNINQIFLNTLSEGSLDKTKRNEPGKQKIFYS